jgi:hypothetical protein
MSSLRGPPPPPFSFLNACWTWPLQINVLSLGLFTRSSLESCRLNRVADCYAIATATVAQADLDWTIFRVPLLNDNDADLTLWAGLLGPTFRGTNYLNRGSLARWVLDEIEERNWVRKAPASENWGRVDDGRIVRSTLVG